jgi:hypothetical protein
MLKIDIPLNKEGFFSFSSALNAKLIITITVS